MMSDTEEEDRKPEESETEEDVPITKAGMPKWDVATDAICRAIRSFFEQDPPCTVTRNCMLPATNEGDSEVAVGKMLYALRTSYRATNQNPLTKARLAHLADIPELQTFLAQPAITKQKPSTTNTRLASYIRSKLQATSEATLQLECSLAKKMHTIAEQELGIFRCQKRQRL